MLEADKHLEFLDDPDGLPDDFDGLEEEQIKELKREWVIIFCCYFHSLTWTRDLEIVGRAATKLYKNSAVWFPTFRKK